jgi:AraC-like DNA-binding protein
MTILSPNKNCFSGKSEKLWKFYSLVKDFSWKIGKGEGIFIVFIIEGSIEVSVNNVETHVVNSKEMFLTEDGSFYIIEAVKQTQLMTCLFHGEIFLSEQTLINQLVPLCNENKEKFSCMPVKDALSSYLVLLQTYMQDNVNSAYFFDLKRQELFMLLCFYYSKGELAQFLHPLISANVEFKQLVMNNYRKVKNVKELAAKTNYSTSGFIKRFRRSFNESPYGWMQKQRARQIRIEIKQGIKSLQEIAVEYKFSSYQHFSSFCKKQFGLPPTKINN